MLFGEVQNNHWSICCNYNVICLNAFLPLVDRDPLPIIHLIKLLFIIVTEACFTGDCVCFRKSTWAFVYWSSQIGPSFHLSARGIFRILVNAVKCWLASCLAEFCWLTSVFIRFASQVELTRTIQVTFLMLGTPMQCRIRSMYARAMQCWGRLRLPMSTCICDFRLS